MGFVVETPPGDVAFSIALGVLLLTVVLEPIIRACVHRIRAARAWKSIKNNEAVDITKYNIFSEALGDRGRWDTARVVTIMLSAFHVSTWGLELSLDLAVRTDGPVDLMNRPPPVLSSGNPDDVSSVFDWIVQENLNHVDEKGTLNNFKNGTLDGYATSVYRIGDGLVMGSRVFASWSTVPGNSPSQLFYDVGDAPTMVDGMVCSAGATSHTVFLSGGDDGQQKLEWGTATECDAGPALLNATAQERPPVILLSGGNSLHVIVEEDSSYPSFLYSVWRPVLAGDGSDASDPAEMHHVFYVSSTTRLAEAIVSGVVNGITSGGGCVDLLSQFSMTNTTYDLGGMSRVAPFGEYPSFASVESIDDVEEIVAGVKVSDIGTVCGLILMVVTGASFAGCLISMKSRGDMDVFDRDAVIRAVALPNGQDADITSPSLKIYVRQSDDTRFGMVVSDDTGRRRWVNRCVKGVTSAFARTTPTHDSDDDDDDDEPLPARGLSRSWSLPRASFTRVSSDRERLSLGSLDEPPVVPVRTPLRTPPAQSPSYVELIASPIPSLVRRGSVLRGLPTFFSSSMTGVGLEDSSKERAHSSMTDQGHASPGAASRPTKGRADSALQSALHGDEMPPADASAPTPDDGEIPEPAAVPAGQIPATTRGVKMGGVDTCSIAPLGGDVTAKERQADESAAKIVDEVEDGADEALNLESTGGVIARTAGPTGCDAALDGGVRRTVNGSPQATHTLVDKDVGKKPTSGVGPDELGGAFPSLPSTAASEKNGGQTEKGTVNTVFGGDGVGATTPPSPFGGLSRR